MSLFQLIGLSVFGALIAVDVIGMLRGDSSRKARALWLVIWLIGAGAMIVPDITTKLAMRLGIQRGTDLVLYTAVLGGLAFAFFAFLQFRRLDRQITLIVRQIALENAEPRIDAATVSQSEQRQPDNESQR